MGCYPPGVIEGPTCCHSSLSRKDILPVSSDFLPYLFSFYNLKIIPVYGSVGADSLQKDGVFLQKM